MITNIIFRRSDSPITSDKPHYENVPFEVPNSWGWCKLHDIIQITNGRSQKDVENVNGKYPIYGSGGIIGKAVEYLCEAGSTIIGRKGTINNPLFVEERFWNIDTAFGMKPMYAISDLYFFYFCQYFDFSKLDKSTAVPSLTQSAIGEVFIPIPPINEQKRITDGISYWFGFIDTLESNLNNLQLTIKQTKSKILDLAIHGQLVPQNPTDEPASELLKRINPKAEITCENGHYQKLPEGWCETQLGDIFNHNTGKALNSSNTEGTLKDYLTTSNVYWNSFDFSVIKKMLFKESELNKCQITKGDLLVCEGGDIGRAAIWDYDYDICIQNHLHRLRPKVNGLCVSFYYYVLYYLKINNMIGGKGIGLLGLSSNALHKLHVPFPSLNEQHRIVSKIEEIFAQLDAIEALL